MSHIRPYRAADRDHLADICLRTGDAGADATGLHAHDNLLADIFALPYVEFDPTLTFVVDAGERIDGYIVATANTNAFISWYQAHWWPSVAPKYAALGEHAGSGVDMIAMGQNTDRMVIAEHDDYPAHLHIDLLPHLQGQGHGRALMRTLLTELRQRGVPGVHLAVAPRNTSARAFYRRIGFVPLPSDSGSQSLLGIRTDAVI